MRRQVQIFYEVKSFRAQTIFENSTLEFHRFLEPNARMRDGKINACTGNNERLK